MMSSDELNTIIERIASGTQTATDVKALRVALSDRNQDLLQLGKYNVNIGQGQDIHIGDRTYVTWNDEAIQALIEVVQKLQSTTQTPTPQLASVDDLVQQVRSHVHDDIQRLHGTMPLWGVDRWVPLGELFVDVNILEELSSSRKSELDDLWQDFTTGMQGYSSYRSLERIGLGRERQRVSGLEVLARNTNLMVVGKPGSGKTTYLQRVVTECNAGNLQAHRIPVLIKLREFVEDGREVAYSLERYLERCWRLSKAETQLVLDRGRVLVLLDGLDEVTGEDGKKIAYEIKRFARAYPQVQVIVTCRTQSQESRFERFDYVEVADFNEPQVRAFAEHWFKTVMGDESAGLVKAREFLGLLFLEENKPIRELAITPILLSLTCAVFHQTGKFYSKRSKLYEEGLELLLEQWDKSREIERDEIYRDLSVERKLELLSYLAVKKFEQSQYVLFEQGEIEGYIAEFLGIGQQDSRVVLKAIEAQHGLLIERTQKIWSFSHLTFHEYLVAKTWLVSEDWQILVRHLTQRHWNEVFFIVCETTISANNLIQIMKLNIDELIPKDNRRIQEFLIWISHKFTSLEIRDTSFGIKLFYYSINSDTVNPPMDLLFELGVNVFPFQYDEGNRNIPLSLDIALIRVLEGVPKKFRSINDSDFTNQFIFSVISSLESTLSDLELSINLAQNNSLKNHLSLLMSSLPLHKNRKNRRSEMQVKQLLEWWNENGYSWVNQLRKIVFEYRKIGQLWNFNEFEKNWLETYYKANKLLKQCLEISCYLTLEIQQEIEEAFLSPITEIEKCKCEKSEDDD